MARRSQPNPFIGVNYLDIDSKMPAPPRYWLQQLFDFDADLVMFPSIVVPFAYVLARRARVTGGLNAQDPAMDQAQPDTKFCLTRHLLPVSLIYRHNAASWSIENILRELKARDLWAVGGAEKYVDLADASDKQKENKQRAEIRDDMYNRSGDAWRSYQARTGQRSKILYGHRTKKIQVSTQ